MEMSCQQDDLLSAFDPLQLLERLDILLSYEGEVALYGGLLLAHCSLENVKLYVTIS